MTSNKKLSAVAMLLVAAGAGLGYGVAHWRTASMSDPSATVSGTKETTKSPAGERKALYWYDPMVPQQKFD
ncbi:efflux RND transporter periplasmic adaptor subunit, partial [Klebsiella pneumoniae]|nr:efflux RND transporter periplasmic adaptor subunit [Klebsiella pneumoniae]